MHATMQSTHYISSNLVGEIDEHAIGSEIFVEMSAFWRSKVLHAMKNQTGSQSCVQFNEVSAIGNDR